MKNQRPQRSGKLCVVYARLFTKPKKKIRSKGLQNEKVNGPKAEASAEMDVVPTRLRDPHAMTRSWGTGRCLP